MIENKKQIKNKIVYNSLISKEIKIINSKNKSEIGLVGILVNERKDFFDIKTKDNVIKKIKKINIEFEITIDLNKFLIKGCELNKTLINRIKNK